MSLRILKKLILNNKFRPLPVDDGDELFPNGIFVFNISKLITFIKSNPNRFLPEEIEVQSLRSFTSNKLDELTIKTANLSEPIVLAEISPGNFNIIDGRHRLEKAYRNNVSKIPAYKIHARQHLEFLTSLKAYKKYIEYWNAKIDKFYESKC